VSCGSKCHTSCYRRGDDGQMVRHVKLITSKQRWSYLEHLIYLPPSSVCVEVRSLDLSQRPTGLTRSRNLCRLHPCASLILDQELHIPNRFPSDLSMTSREALQLYEAMHATLTNAMKGGKHKEVTLIGISEAVLVHRLARMNELEPQTWFKTMYIQRQQAVKWDAALKEECTSWLNDNLSPLLYEAIKVTSPSHSGLSLIESSPWTWVLPRN
jgi:hypothetical protein